MYSIQTILTFPAEIIQQEQLQLQQNQQEQLLL